MMQTLVSASVLTVMLCGPALADPPAPVKTPIAANQPLRISVGITAGAASRTHDLLISDGGCGRIVDKTAAYEDEIRVCSRPAASTVQLEVDWSSHAGAATYRSEAVTILARTGGTVQVGRAGGIRLALTLL